MQVVRPGDIQPDSTPRPIFVGEVSRRLLISEDVAQGLRLTMVNFSPGARTVVHTHTHEQVLYVTQGRGIVATEQEEHVVTPDTVVYIAPGERHWHGATENSAFSHISVTTPGQTQL